MNHRDVVTETLDEMEGIGGIPTNEEFWEEFEFRMKAKLDLPTDIINPSSLTYLKQISMAMGGIFMIDVIYHIFKILL